MSTKQQTKALPVIGLSYKDDNYLLLDNDDDRERSYRQQARQDFVESGLSVDNEFSFDNWSDN